MPTTRSLSRPSALSAATPRRFRPLKRAGRFSPLPHSAEARFRTRTRCRTGARSRGITVRMENAPSSHEEGAFSHSLGLGRPSRVRDRNGAFRVSGRCTLALSSRNVRPRGCAQVRLAGCGIAKGPQLVEGRTYPHSHAGDVPGSAGGGSETGAPGPPKEHVRTRTSMRGAFWSADLTFLGRRVRDQEQAGPARGGTSSRRTRGCSRIRSAGSETGVPGGREERHRTLTRGRCRDQSVRDRKGASEECGRGVFALRTRRGGGGTGTGEGTGEGRAGRGGAGPGGVRRSWRGGRRRRGSLRCRHAG